MDEKERRIRAITRLYYSNPKVQEVIAEFSKDREVVPRYFEGFGKRPDMIQYSSDVMGLVRKGATSFHASEEIWQDPLKLNSDMKPEEANDLRKGWDLLIDIDSPFLDCSKIAATLIIGALEQHGIKNYGIKFSGSKGFHIIVGSKAFPKECDGKETRVMFPVWPRAISEYLMNYIRKDYNKMAGEVLTDFEAIERRTKLSKEELTETHCGKCGRTARGGAIVQLYCPRCRMRIERKDPKVSKRKLRCLDAKCGGILETADEKKYFFCDYCKDPKNEKMLLDSDKYPEMFEKVQGVSAEKIANLDLVLVAPRHLFRAPYSLHEKTALVSAVLTKEEIENFDLSLVNPLKIKFREFMPKNSEGEARKLLSEALDWKATQRAQEEEIDKKVYADKGNFEELKYDNITENMFPPSIKKLMGGMKDGKKRGLFILITFLRNINYSPEKIYETIKKWNEKNDPPLKEGYVKSQINWHIKQKRKILPPNYSNNSFYKDLGLIDKMPDAKNPLVEISRRARRGKN